ncbi:6-phospho-3-hexuloisomerase [Alicyclobacillus fructus]|uniref:6-phospho-3-hexuloisomerase n=1 Tax=Alicyclobacillus fructus TaxID=2816082 RepID=UPI001A8ED9D4|nr:6-phospho-3-hexuloisomerase [Alicyclobacillus fructus]
MTVLQTIMDEMRGVLERIDERELVEWAHALLSAKRIFVVGEGRSGLMAKAFAMRLMHLGATVYVVGETITPAVGEGDLLVGVSGSGETEAVVSTTEKSLRAGAMAYAITANVDSPLAQRASATLVVPAATKYRREREASSMQPLGSLFDQSLHVILDAICLLYGSILHEDNESAFQRHSNLE